VKPVEKFAQVGSALEPPAAGHADQLRTAWGPLVLEILEQTLDGVGAQLVIEQHTHIAQRQRLGRTNQSGLQDALGIRSIHVLASKEGAAEKAAAVPQGHGQKGLNRGRGRYNRCTPL
jgi:hypothetical protein